MTLQTRVGLTILAILWVVGWCRAIISTLGGPSERLVPLLASLAAAPFVILALALFLRWVRSKLPRLTQLRIRALADRLLALVLGALAAAISWRVFLWTTRTGGWFIGGYTGERYTGGWIVRGIPIPLPIGLLALLLLTLGMTGFCLAHAFLPLRWTNQPLADEIEGERRLRNGRRRR